MARAISAADIIARGRRYADMENSAFIGEQEALDLFNAGYSELYDQLVAVNENYFAAKYAFSIDSVTPDYDLPEDFYKLLAVDWMTTPTSPVALKPFLEAERNSFGIASALPAGTVRIKYVPFCPLIVDTTTLIDGINGFEDYIAWFMAVRMLNKEESSTTVAERQLDRFVRRIEMLAPNRDQGMPYKVTDITKMNYLQRVPQLRYQLNGAQITLISSEFITADFYGY